MSLFLWISFICPHAKLVDIFIHESGVTSLQDAFTSRFLKTPLCCIIMFHINHGEVLSFTIYTEFSPSCRLLVSTLATYATAYRTKFPSSTGPLLYTETGKQKLHVIGTVSSLRVQKPAGSDLDRFWTIYRNGSVAFGQFLHWGFKDPLVALWTVCDEFMIVSMKSLIFAMKIWSICKKIWDFLYEKCGWFSNQFS